MKNFSLKKFVRYILRCFTFGLFGLLLVKGTHKLIDGPTKKTTQCGVVVKQYESNDVRGRHGDYTVHNYYLDVDFDNGPIESMDVTTDTWYSSPPGKHVCFYRVVDQTAFGEIFDLLAFSVAVLFYTALTLTSIYYFGNVIYWAFTGRWQG